MSSITKVFDSNSVGTFNFTAQHKAIYLIICSGGCGGSPTITLPIGKAPIFSKDWDPSVVDNRTWRCRVIELDSEDVVEISTAQSISWPSFQMTVYELNGFSYLKNGTEEAFVEVIDDHARYNDYQSSNDSYLAIGTCYSWGSKPRQNYTTGGNPIISIEESVGNAQINGIYYAKGSNMPDLDFYGYDGGGSFVYVLRFNENPHIRAQGNIRAIGDWFKATRYYKTEIDEFFILKNAYTPYVITIIGEENSVVTITGQTSGRSYNIELASGERSKLLFFTTGETIVATDGKNTITKVLSNQVDEIDLATPEISLVFKAENQPTTSGAVKDYTYTAEKSGYYLILYWEFMNIQLITELDDVLISGQVLDNYGSPHMKYWICRLDAGDEVLTRITTSDSSGYYFYSALIFKLDGIIDRNSVELYTTFDRQDGNTSYDISTDSYKHLIFTSWQTNGNGGDQTNTSVKKGEAMVSSIVSAWPNRSSYTVTTCIYYGDKTNLPTPIKNYSWNWGRGQLVDIITKK